MLGNWEKLKSLSLVVRVIKWCINIQSLSLSKSLAWEKLKTVDSLENKEVFRKYLRHVVKVHNLRWI